MTNTELPFVRLIRWQRKLQKKGGICYDPIVEHFGTEILDEKGRLDRKKLSDIVFGDPKELNVLNEIVHPAVKEEVNKKIKKEERKNTNSSDCRIGCSCRRSL